MRQGAESRAQGFLVKDDRGLFRAPENDLFPGIHESNGWGTVGDLGIEWSASDSRAARGIFVQWEALNA